MELSVTDMGLLVYNYAVILSGGVATMQLGIDDRMTLVVLLLPFALFWSGYFRLRMVPRLVDKYGSDDEAQTVANET